MDAALYILSCSFDIRIVRREVGHVLLLIVFNFRKNNLSIKPSVCLLLNYKFHGGGKELFVKVSRQTRKLSGED